MKKITLIISVVLFLLTSACTNVSTIPLGTYMQRPPTNSDLVEVYLSDKDVPGNYKKIALIYAEEAWVSKSAGALIQMMRIKAAKAGANGLILNEIRSVTDFSDMESGPSVNKTIKGVAIFVEK